MRPADPDGPGGRPSPVRDRQAFHHPDRDPGLAADYRQRRRFGYRDRPWAKHVAFWIGVLATAHWFFAIFYSKTLKTMLGAAWEPVAVAITLVLAYLTWPYRRRNELGL